MARGMNWLKGLGGGLSAGLRGYAQQQMGDPNSPYRVARRPVSQEMAPGPMVDPLEYGPSTQPTAQGDGSDELGLGGGAGGGAGVGNDLISQLLQLLGGAGGGGLGQ